MDAFLEIVLIHRIVRRMRGGSQAQLVQADDGHYYVAKFADNPQGSRTLINEWIAGFLLRTIGVCTPELRVMRVGDSCITDELFFQVGSQRKPVLDCFHLGSRCPANPETTAVFDFLPLRLLERVSNLADFGRVFVVDCWLGQTDTRQAVYIRNRETRDVTFSAWMIDHGLSLGGSEWDLKVCNGGHRCFNFGAYNLIDMPAAIEQAVKAVLELPDSALYSLADGIPEQWFSAGDREILRALLTDLNKRRQTLRERVSRCWSNAEQSRKRTPQLLLLHKSRRKRLTSEQR